MTAAGGAVGLYGFFRPGPAARFERVGIRKLSGTGKSVRAAISPDGKYVAHVMDNDGRQSVWLRQVEAESNLQLLAPEHVNYEGLSFSPDGNHLYYVKFESASPISVLYRVPTLGGAAKPVSRDLDSAVSFSPDGQRIAYLRALQDRAEDLLLVANADGTGERTLHTVKKPSRLGRAGPSWAPDGERIACSLTSFGSGGQRTEIIEVNVGDGATKNIGSRAWHALGGIAWLPDGGGLVVNAAEHSSAPWQLWHVSYPGGEARRVTRDMNHYTGAGLSADAGVIVSVQREQIANVWLAPDGDAGRAAQITSGASKDEGLSGVALSPDGRVFYTSGAGGGRDIWVMNADGSARRQLTVEAGSNIHPAVSKDGQHIAFASTRAGASNIWVMDREGGNLRQLTRGAHEWHPHWSPDGRWVIYNSTGEGTPAVWKVPAGGGDPVRLTGGFSMYPSVSPDGKLVACLYWDDQVAEQRYRIALVTLEGGRIVKLFDIPPLAALAGKHFLMRWMPDGQALTYMLSRGGVTNIWTQPLAGGEPKQLTNFQSEQVFSFDWSRDGKQLVVARGIETSDVVLINELR